jgi:very-short-patch-repair endonuclease/phage head maturation protease
MKELLNQLEREVQKRNIPSEEVSDIISSIPPLLNRRIIMGYASVAMVDRENQKISIEALREAVKRFMSDGRYRIISIFHSDAVIGRVLPRWTDPKSGKIHKTEVDDVGWKVVVELRDDIELANKVWDEIIKGNLRSFSVAGTAKKKHDSTSSGTQYTEIDELDLLEVTVCVPENSKVWTKVGLKNIQDITTDDYVFSHAGKWQKVNEVMKRQVNEEIYSIHTENGVLTATSEHPIRTLIYGGRYKGTNYKWVPIKDLKEGNLISWHKFERACKICGTPIFSGSHAAKNRKFYCSQECHYKDEGNRKGCTILSGDLSTISQANKLRGITKKENPRLSGGVKTEEGKLKQKLSKQTPEFKKKRSEIQSNLWKNPIYAKEHRDKINTAFKTPEYSKKRSTISKEMWQNEEIATKILKAWAQPQNKMEIKLENILNKLYPNEWKFVGNGDFWISGKNPDFINVNGQKKVIELNGEFWHQDINKTEERIELFKEFGYETLIITDTELKNDILTTKNKIKEFCGNGLSKVLKIEKIDYCGFVYNLSVEEDESYTLEAGVVHNCSVPVNPMSMFQVLYNPKEVTI